MPITKESAILGDFHLEPIHAFGWVKYLDANETEACDVPKPKQFHIDDWFLNPETGEIIGGHGKASNGECIAFGVRDGLGDIYADLGADNISYNVKIGNSHPVFEPNKSLPPNQWLRFDSGSYLSGIGNILKTE